MKLVNGAATWLAALASTALNCSAGRSPAPGMKGNSELTCPTSLKDARPSARARSMSRLTTRPPGPLPEPLPLGPQPQTARRRQDLGGGQLLQNRPEGAARPAPGGPEIHHHRQIALFNVSLEVAFVQNNRPGVKQRLMAAAALRPVAEPLRRNAVDAVAMRTDDMGDSGH